MKLSICMMVKDEEKNLKRCLDKVKPIVDSGLAELIIVDTGSTDNTEVISREYTDKIYFHKWNKNFSEMRNLSISYAKGEWIFIIDADERLDDYKKLIALMNSAEINKYNTIILQVKNLYNLSDENRYNLIASPRIFRNDGKFRYEGAVHNQPIFKGPNLIVDINLTHFGYISTDKELMELKYKRTSELLKCELGKDPENLYYIYQLGVSYDMHGDYKEALNEFRKAYSILNNKSLEEKKKYTYIYASYARIAYNNNEYNETLIVAKEALTLKKDYIDLYYLLGISEKQLGNEEDMVKYFNKYIDLIKNYNELEASKDLTIIMYHTDDRSKSTVYFQLAQYYIGLQKYKDAYKLYNNIISINEKIYAGINILVPLEKYSELRKIYNNVATSEDKNNFLCTLEDKLKNIEGYQKLSLFEEFSKNEDLYGLFNKVRITNNADEKMNLTKLLIKKLDLNSQPVFYSEVFVNIKENIDLIIDTLKEVEVWNLKAIVKYLVEEKKFGVIFEKFVLEKRRNIIDMKELNLFISIATILLAIYIKDNKEISSNYLDIFKKYVEVGISFISKLYQVNKAEDIYKSIKNEEDRFFMVFYIIDKCIKSNDKKSAVKYMIEAVNLNKAFSKYIDIYKDEIFNLKQTSATNEEKEQFESYKSKVKENINKLINEGNLGESKKLINEYEKIVKKDPEIYSMKAVIAIIEGNFHEAEQIIKKGINIDPNFGELYYNLAYIRKLNKNNKDYLRYLTISYNRSTNEDNKLLMKNEIGEQFNLDESNLLVKISPVKVLIVCHFYSVFSVELIENLYKSYNIVFEVLTMDSRYLELHNIGIVKKVHSYNNIQQLLNCLEGLGKFDIVNVHFVTPFYSSVAKELKRIANNLICSFWGSDFYRITNKERKEQEVILNEANLITFCNEEMTEKFNSFNKDRYISNIRFVRFGLAPLNEIKFLNDSRIDKNKIKDKFSIPKNKIVVVCGYSSNPIHNHIEVIENLIRLDDDLLSKLFFVFPMTYGDKNYCNQIKTILESTKLNYAIFDTYMSNKEVAELRIISEIMIHVPLSDQLSGTMQETLYCGGIVITGSWLPYKVLKDKGIKYLEVNNINQINDKIAYAVNNFDYMNNINKDSHLKIWELSSWDKNIENWFDLYNERG